jgi:hypothetical protein
MQTFNHLASMDSKPASPRKSLGSATARRGGPETKRGEAAKRGAKEEPAKKDDEAPTEAARESKEARTKKETLSKEMQGELKKALAKNIVKVIY